MLKLYAWENSFAQKIMGIRKEEFNNLKQRGMYDSIVTFLFTAVPFLVAISTFTCYVLIDSTNVLDAHTAFVAMTIFNLLRLPVNFFPVLFGVLIRCSVSLRRIEKFLNCEEKKPEVRILGLHLMTLLMSLWQMKTASFSHDTCCRQLAERRRRTLSPAVRPTSHGESGR